MAFVAGPSLKLKWYHHINDLPPSSCRHSPSHKINNQIIAYNLIRTPTTSSQYSVWLGSHINSNSALSNQLHYYHHNHRYHQYHHHHHHRRCRHHLSAQKHTAETQDGHPTTVITSSTFSSSFSSTSHPGGFHENTRAFALQQRAVQRKSTIDMQLADVELTKYMNLINYIENLVLTTTGPNASGSPTATTTATSTTENEKWQNKFQAQTIKVQRALETLRFDEKALKGCNMDNTKLFEEVKTSCKQVKQGLVAAGTLLDKLDLDTDTITVDPAAESQNTNTEIKAKVISFGKNLKKNFRDIVNRPTDNDNDTGQDAASNATYSKRANVKTPAPSSSSSFSSSTSPTSDEHAIEFDLEAFKASVNANLQRLQRLWSNLNGTNTSSRENLAQRFRWLIESSEVVSNLKNEIDVLEKQLLEKSKAREIKLRKEDQLGKLIRAKEFSLMDNKVCESRRILATKVLTLEMEQIFLYLKEEIEINNELFDVLLLIVEFNQLDERLSNLENLIAQQQCLLIQDDELGALAADIQYLKSRIGLDVDFYNKTDVLTTSLRVMDDWKAKAAQGSLFFFRGFKLIGGDVMYAAKLIQKASLGTTLSPREVRTLRRTGRDLLTFIPFTIILIAPLTPVGHVLIFSFIQRFFPDFFPSTFTERRQELMKMYDGFRKTIEESGDEIDQKSTSSNIKKLTTVGAETTSKDDLHLAE